MSVNCTNCANLTEQLAALRRPVVQSAEVETIRTYHERFMNCHRLDPSSAGNEREYCTCSRRWPCEYAHVQILLSALDAAQREISDLKTSSNAHLDRLQEAQKEVIRLSTPPRDRKDIQERQHGMRNVLADWSTKVAGPLMKQAVADIDTLQRDLAAYERAHAILMAERDEARSRVAQLTGELDLYSHSLQGANASVSAYQRRVERLEGALRQIRDFPACDRGTVVDACNRALAAADGQQTAVAEGAQPITYPRGYGPGDGVSGD